MQHPATATDSALGSGRWGAGPTIVALQQQKGWTYGVLANHIWSYAGWGDENVNSTFLQPFVGYTTKTFTTFMVNSESTYDWQEHQWSVPLNFMVNQMLKVGSSRSSSNWVIGTTPTGRAVARIGVCGSPCSSSSNDDEDPNAHKNEGHVLHKKILLGYAAEQY